MTDELSEAIRQWWLALKDHHGGSDQQLAEDIEARAWRRAGSGPVQPVDRRNVSAWRSRGQFPPGDEHLQAAVLTMMRQMAAVDGPPAGAGRWADVDELHRAWLASRAALEEAPPPRTVEANTRRAQRLEDVLVDDTDTTVLAATSSKGLRAGFWQGSWITGGKTPPYVPRLVDGELDRRLRQAAAPGKGGLLVVVGDPKAGKTRSLLEALRRTVPDRRLWQLEAVDGALAAVTAAVEADGGRRGAFDPDQVVVLIDDLQRHSFHTTAGVNHKTLQRAIRNGLLVVATLHTETLRNMEAYARDTSRTAERANLAIGATPKLVDLIVAHRVYLPSALTDTELAGMPAKLARRLEGSKARPGTLARLPERMAAVDALRARANGGFNDRENPERAAIVLASWDAHHVHPAGATLAQLEQLSSWAFEYLFPTRHWDPNLFVRAFEWATAPIGGPGSVHAVVRPLNPGGSLYGMFDPLVPALDMPDYLGRLSPHVQHFDAEACRGLGARRLHRWDSPDPDPDPDAVVWLERAAVELPSAMYKLGIFYMAHGPLPLAERWFLMAARSDVTDSQIARQLAFLYEEMGREREVEQWKLETADRSAHTPGRYLMSAAGDRADRADAEGELELLLRAARSGFPNAQQNLSRLYRERGDEPAARYWEGRLLRDGGGIWLHEEWRVLAREAAEHAGTRRAPDERFVAWSLAAATDSGWPPALKESAKLAERSGDLERAQLLRQRLSSPTDWKDQLHHGFWCLQKGRRKRAAVWLRGAADLGSPDAMWLLGWIVGGAERDALWREAADLGNEEAMTQLAMHHLDRGEAEQAEIWFLRAADRYSLPAIRHLAQAAADDEDEQQAKAWWRKGAECYDPESTLRLAMAYLAEGDEEEGERWLFKAAAKTAYSQPYRAESGALLFSRDLAFSIAALMLARRNHARGNHDEMEKWLDWAADGDASQGLANRGLMYWLAGDRETAQEWWTQLLGIGDEGAAFALWFVGTFLKDEEPEQARMWLLAAGEGFDPDDLIPDDAGGEGVDGH